MRAYVGCECCHGCCWPGDFEGSYSGESGDDAVMEMPHVDVDDGMGVLGRLILSDSLISLRSSGDYLDGSRIPALWDFGTCSFDDGEYGSLC